MRRRIYLSVDVHNPAVEADEERPARGERLIFIDDAVGGRHRLGRVAEQWVIEAQRLREGLVGLGCVNAGREMRDVEAPDLLATLTE